MRDNHNHESATASSRILNRSDTTEGLARSDKGLGGSQSENGIHSGARGGRGSAGLCGDSATNPATSGDTPISHARNGLQLLRLVRGRELPRYHHMAGPWDANLRGPVVLRFEGELAHVIKESELKAIEDRIMAVIAQLEAEKAARREILQVVRLAAEEDLREMERTNRELAGDPSVLLEQSGR